MSATFGETQSSLKDIGLSLSGNLAAIAHVLALDEILKNTFAKFAFKNCEAASYRSLITLADAAASARRRHCSPPCSTRNSPWRAGSTNIMRN
ncbi:DUF892 family protein [Sphingomonas sp. HHU CXW]|uniref:DUF892 family protein n=1 Tax=Sphingomonas hominis TaxID=2741495 RepID=A0ABX2JJK9_9SPHN|nr:DUF892 family protein [Sphingomonas hominis]